MFTTALTAGKLFFATYKIWIVVAAVAAMLGGITYSYSIVYDKGKLVQKNADAAEKLKVERAANLALAAANAKAEQSNAQFSKLQQDAEIQNHENQIIVNNARTQLASIKRLRDPGHRTASGCKLPENATATSVAIDQTAPAELSAELDGFLKQQAYAADQLAVYAQTCYEWSSGLAIQ